MQRLERSQYWQVKHALREEEEPAPGVAAVARQQAAFEEAP
jgi:hypothetical protein